MEDDLDLSGFDGRVRLFPLPGVVLFPHAVLPLHIFEPRYRQMTHDALATDKLITLVQVKPDASWTGEGEPALETVACLGQIISHERLGDGRYNFLLLGRKRVRIVRELAVPTLYRQAEVEILHDIPTVKPERPRCEDLSALYREIARKTNGLDPDLDRLLQSAPSLSVITDLLAQSLGLPPAIKQALLEEQALDRRADGLAVVLRNVLEHLNAIASSSRDFPPPFSAN